MLEDAMGMGHACYMWVLEEEFCFLLYICNSFTHTHACTHSHTYARACTHRHTLTLTKRERAGATDLCSPEFSHVTQYSCNLGSTSMDAEGDSLLSLLGIVRGHLQTICLFFTMLTWVSESSPVSPICALHK